MYRHLADWPTLKHYKGKFNSRVYILRLKMGTYRRLPTTIEAYQWKPDDPLAAGEIAGFLIAKGIDFKITEDKQLLVWVEKSEQHLHIDHYDWMMVEPDGEGVYPCVDTVFQQTYEELPEVAE